MKFSVIASDSSGNCCYIESGETRVLIDAGLSCKRIGEGLERIGVPLASIQAVCFTHDHSDHTQAAGTLFSRHKIPLYATLGTAESVNFGLKTKTKPEWNIFAAGADFTIGSLAFHPFHIPHDASEPVGFVVRDTDAALGFATDMGEAPDMVVRRLSPCNALLLEFNHELNLLLNHPSRPWDLKQRIRGRAGHLSNDQAAELLERIAGPHLRTVFLAHISEECNTLTCARDAAISALTAAGVLATTNILIPKDLPSPLIEV